MKQKDITLIIVVIFISAILSFVLSNQFIAPPKNRQEKVEVVESITSDFQDSQDKELKKYFNDKSYNPTQIIRIGNGSNEKPFNDKPQ